MPARCTVRHSSVLGPMLMLALLGCGSRSDVGQLDLAPSEADGGTGLRDAATPSPLRDAAMPPRRDASVPRPDAGSVEACRLIADEPRTIFIENPGSFDRPQAVARGGTFDLLATFFSDTDDRIPLPYGSRFDDRLEPAGGLAGGGGVSGPQHGAARGDWLGICATRDGLVHLTGFPGDTADFDVPVVRGFCHDLVGNGDRWLVVYQEEVGPGWWYQLRDVAGGPVTWGAPLRTRTDVTEPGASATAFGDGFAWALSPDDSRTLEVGFLDAGGAHRAVEIEEVFPAFASPAIAPWPFDPEGAVAVAHHDLDGVTLRVIDADTGEVRLHTEPFGFSMGGDVTPALVSRPDGLIVAMLNYGDFVPTNGMLEIVAVGPGGEESSRVSMEANRWNLVQGGIDAATDGDAIVVHWADVEGDTGGEIAPVTRAMTLRCE